MIKKVIEFALDKPLLNHMFLFLIVVMSIFAYTNIPKEIFPPIQMDKISINGAYAGTSADILDKMAVQSIEDDLKNINELDTIKTTIRNGNFSIFADIKSGSDNLAVLSDVKDVIASVKKDLPADMVEPTAKIHVENIPLVLIAIAGEHSTKELLEKAEELKSSLSEFKDLSDISIRGDADDELVIRLNEEKIKAYGLDYMKVVSAVGSISSIFPIGTIKENSSHLYISTYNGEKDINKIKDTVVQVGVSRVSLGSIADISYELSDENEISHYQGLKNISINVTKAKSGNAIALAKDIKEMLHVYEKKYPSYKFAVYTDTSIWIKSRLNTVFANIMFGLILVFLAMLIFVNRGIAIVVAMGIPLSFMIGLIVTNNIGYSLNMLSLLGALIALGMLVDEAIVVAENIYRHLEEGKDRREATILGATEMFPAVLTATATTIFAFLPMLMLSGEMGTFIRILPIMISVLLLSSLFEAFYFLPLHAYDFLKVRKSDHKSSVIWDFLYKWYDKILHTLFHFPRRAIAVMIVSILCLTYLSASVTKFQLFPEFDVTQVFITGKVNINNDLKNTEKYVSKIEKVLLEKLSHEEYTSVTSVVGMRLDSKNKAELGDNLFHIFIDLHERAPSNFYNKYINPLFALDYNKSLKIREKSAKDISKEIESWLKDIQANNDFEDFEITVPGTGVVAHDIELSVSGKDDKQTEKAINKIQDALSKINGVHSITNDMQEGESELKLRVNTYGQELGLNEQLISKELSSYYLKGEYSKMFNDDGLIRIKVEGRLKDQLSSIDDFEVQVPNSSNFVKLKDVCDFMYKKAYVSIVKEDSVRLRSVYASQHKDVVTAAEVTASLKPTIKELEDEGFKVEVKGEQAENDKNKKEMGEAGILAIILIFITLVWLFDSFKQSFIVLSNIPLMLLGVYLGHFIMGLNFTMPALIGIVGLAGVVVNDGLIMVDFIKKASNVEDLIQRAKTRLRPILLTSITTVLGLSTLIFFAEGQAMILQPMAVALGFGLAWATVLNLIYIPLLYAVSYKIRVVKEPKE